MFFNHVDRVFGEVLVDLRDDAGFGQHARQRRADALLTCHETGGAPRSAQVCRYGSCRDD
jgi:hypothetical protein